jgi:hypothetical protein
MNLRATVISPLCITRPGAFHGNIVTAPAQKKVCWSWILNIVPDKSDIISIHQFHILHNKNYRRNLSIRNKEGM